MDLSLTDFNTAFIDSEVIKVSLKTMGGGNIYLRSLCRADITRFQRIADEIHARTAMNLFSPPEVSKRLRDADLADAQDFLVFKALCNPDGTEYFKDLDHFKEFNKKVSNQAIEEILWNINESMVIFFDPEKDKEDAKKKPESSAVV